MKSSWVPLVQLVAYLTLMFVITRLLDLLVWYRQGDLVDPFVLSVRQLKQLLEVRGVTYTGYFEKQELAHLVEASADVSQGELDELDHLVDLEERGRLVKTPQSAQFSGSAHFYEKVEDTKDSVWLVQVVGGSGEPLLDDYKWHVVRRHVAPFAIRTGVFHCKLDKRLCKIKGWNEPLLLLAMPKGSTPKDKVIIRTCTLTKPQQIITWLTEQLSIRVHNITSLQEFAEDWADGHDFKDIKVLFLTQMLHPPLFLAALSIKFTGRIKFGIMTVKREEEGAVGQRLRIKQKLQAPSYVLVTPERTTVYGHRQGEHHNFWAMNSLLRTIRPDTNDVFLFTLITVNMVAVLDVVQVVSSCWWKRLARCIWTVVNYNLWLFIAWLLVLSTQRWSFFSTASDQLLVIVRNIALTDIANNFRNDLLLLYKHPLLFITSFLVFICVAKHFFPNYPSVQRPGGDHWWEVLNLDYFFRPNTSQTQEQPMEELEDWLSERIALPNFWLHTSLNVNDYTKDLPLWKYRPPTDADAILDLMDKSSSESDEGPVKGQLESSSCAVCLESYDRHSTICGLPCGHNFHKHCIHTWLNGDNLHCPICRWPVYKRNHPRLRH